MSDRLDSRVLAALRIVDAETGETVARPLSVKADGARFVRNLSGLHVLVAARGFDDYTSAFDAPPAAAPASLAFVVSDPAGRYLASRYTIDLPRTGPALFEPITVVLYPSPAAPVGAGSAVVRASVKSTGGARLAGALVRVSADGHVMARGLTDARGEALVPVPGIKVTSWNGGGGAVLLSEIDAVVEAGFDPAAAGASGAIPAPQALNDNFAGLAQSSTTTKLASRREVPVSLSIAIA